jgi:hypothetical protein
MLLFVILHNSMSICKFTSFRSSSFESSKPELQTHLRYP